jgi:hypothetical protein
MVSIIENGGGECRRSNRYGRAEVIRLLFCKRCVLLSITAFVVLCAACAGGGAGSPSLQAADSGLPSVVVEDNANGATNGATLAAKQGDFALYILPESKELARQAGRIT